MTKVPVFHMPFNTYKIFSDVSGNDCPVTMKGTVTNGHGKISKYCAFFNGDSGNYLTCTAPSLLLGAQYFTWSLWVMKNVHNPQSYPIFLSFGLPYIAADGSTSPFRFSYINNGSQVNLGGTTIPLLNTWYHIVVTSSSSAVKLYVNGVLENSTSTLNNAGLAGNFDIGRHRGDDRYKVWGRVDDVRIYNEVLSAAEVLELYNGPNNPVVSMKNNGDLVLNGLAEEIDWTLLDGFIASSDNEITPFDANKTLGLPNINSAARLAASGWTSTSTTIDSPSYTIVKGFSQQFLGGDPVGYIEKALPSGYSYVRIRWANFYGGTATLRIGGNVVYTLEANAGVHEYAGPYSGTPTVKFEEYGIYWVSQIWVGKPRAPAIKPFEASFFNIIHNIKSPNLHAYDDWSPGSGDSGNFICNGAVSENARIWAADPWCRPAILWECRPTGNNDADGGWNYNVIPIDRTKLYRVSVWVKRNSTNSGRFFLGCNGYGGTSGVLQRSDGSNNDNPYFFHGVTELPTNTWVLVVGHIWPAGSGVGSVYTNTGIYNTLGVKILNTVVDYVWRADNTLGRARCYLYYTTNTAQRQWMCYPTFEVCDGTEAPISHLVTGKAYTPLGKIPSQRKSTGNLFELSNSGLLITRKLIVK